MNEERAATEQYTTTNIIQTFYNSMASQYDKLFFDWKMTTNEQAKLLDKIFQNNGYDPQSRILDCACGIGTQAVGLPLCLSPLQAAMKTHLKLSPYHSSPLVC